MIGIERTDSVKELAYIYSTADLVLNLSYCENYPTVNLEAIACGTPVLTYCTGGSPESVLQNEGIVVEKGNIEAVADAIKDYKKHNKVKPELGIEFTAIDKNRVLKDYQKIIRGGVLEG